MFNNPAIPIVGIVFLFVAFVVAVFACIMIVWMITRAITKRGGGGNLNKDELRVVQEIHTGLAKMEKRIDALETILLSSRRER